MNEMQRMGRTDSPAPPAIRRNTGRALIVIVCGAVLAVLLFVVVINLDNPDTQQVIVNPDEDVIELVAPPSALTAEEEQRYRQGGEKINNELETRLPSGGWIQMQDDEGRISQRYRFARQEPRPDGWYWLDKPEAHVFLSDSEALILTGDETVAYAPNQALEQGTITGNVVITVYKLDDRRHIDPTTDTPSFIVRTTEATFDNIVGEVRCPGPIHLEAPSKAELQGEALTMRINDHVDRLQMLEMQIVHYIKLIQPEDEPAVAQRTSSNAPSVRLAAFNQIQNSPRDSPKPTQFYELTLTDNVVITQGPVATKRIVRGDKLSITFSTESKGFDDAFAFALPPELFGGAAQPHALDMHPLTLHAFLAVQAIAQTNANNRPVNVPVPGPNEAVITVNGPLRVLPIDDPKKRLDSVENARFEVIGSPVELIDDAEEAVATAGILRYDTLERHVQLIATTDHAVAIDSPQLTAGGDRFWLAQNTGEAGFEGAGWLVPQQDPAAPVDNPQDDILGDTDEMAALLEELRISWSRSVRIDFEPGSDAEAMGPIKRVRFLGDVNIESDQGNISCNLLDLTVTQDADGKPAPETMRASGDVKTADDERTLWADELNIAFLTDNQPVHAESDNDKPRVRNITANGDIQIRMADGSRAFADRLEGDRIDETLELSGENIVIAAGRMLIEKGTRLTLRKDQQFAFWEGPGTARVFDKAIDTGADHRIERPIINNEQSPPIVRTKWDDSLHYDHTVNDGAGAIELRGNVNAVSSQNPTERNTMKGDAVTLEFAGTPEAEAARMERRSADEQFADLEDRRLARFTARGEASIENRTWKSEARSEKPRIFYAAGPYIEYNDLTFESRVIGDGTLLIRDEWADEAAHEPPRINAPGKRADPGATFSGKGTTQFKFNRELHMKQLLEDRYRIEMTGDVTVVHESLAGEIATMTGQQLAAIVTRASDDRQRAAGLDLGGAMELRRIEGSSAVLVRTPTRTVECDFFDYNVDTNLAKVAANPGRSITVLTEGTPYPLQAGEVLWNMANDSITIISGAGAASP